MEEVELNVDISVSPQASDGRRQGLRTISIKSRSRNNREGAVEAAERVAKLLVERQSPGSLCAVTKATPNRRNALILCCTQTGRDHIDQSVQVQLLLDAGQAASIVEQGQHQLLALQASLTARSAGWHVPSATVEILEVPVCPSLCLQSEKKD